MPLVKQFEWGTEAKKFIKKANFLLKAEHFTNTILLFINFGSRIIAPSYTIDKVYLTDNNYPVENSSAFDV